MMTTRNAILVALGAAVLATGCGIGDAQSRLRSAVDAQKPAFDQCYATALERDEKEAGSLEMWVHVDKQTGQLHQVEVSDTSLQDEQLKSCVESALTTVQMDPPPKANLKVEYILQFRPTS
jgi:hypothetical protein